MDAIGCGFEITLHCAVPKRSGLGTSSILGATIIAALHRFFGKTRTMHKLFIDVLELGQMLTTGGGFALFASSSVETASKLREMLCTGLDNQKARIVDLSLHTNGLLTTVS